MKHISSYIFISFLSLVALQAQANPAHASTTTFDTFEAKPPIHGTSEASSTLPKGLTPAEVKTAYHLPHTGGSGTIAIITAYHHPMVEIDLATFNKKFSIAPCTLANKCLEIHEMSTSTRTNENRSFETALDTEWAHAIAPEAKILVVESKSSKASDLLKAVDYARGRSGVVSVSMSWGGDEFPTETKLDSYFATTSTNKLISFFASSGDDGTGASWPAVSPKVIAVGGTSLTMKKNVASSSWTFAGEKAWTGSGGGLSLYETQPAYQKTYSIPQSNGRRSIPDVSYAADPVKGFSVYHLKNPDENSNRMSIYTVTAGGATTASSSKNTAANKGWYVIGGTSAGAPQWAAIAALGIAGKHPISHISLYDDKSATTYSKYFRDIVSGKNGTCTYYCVARKHYDFVTGLGSPITYLF